MRFNLEKKHGFGFVLSLCLCFFLAQWANAEGDADKKSAVTADDLVIASMGDVKLFSSELNRLFSYSDPQAKHRVLSNPQLLEQTIREELFKKFIVQQAGITGFVKQPQTEWAMTRAGENILLELFLASQSKPEENYPPEEMIKGAYVENLSRFNVPNRVHVAQIFLPTSGDEKADKATIATVNDLATKAKKAKADFAGLAKQHSKHVESASNGGDMGWIPLDQLLPEVSKVVATMKAGEIQGPIKSPQGMHIIKLLESKPASVRTLEEVKPLLVAGLKKQRMEALRAEFLKKLLEKTPATINGENVSKLK